VERNYFCQWYWCGRFCWKVCVVFWSLFMVDLIVFLFVRFHVMVCVRRSGILCTILFETLSNTRSLLCVGWFGGGIIRLLRCGIIGINKNYNYSTRQNLSLSTTLTMWLGSFWCLFLLSAWVCRLWLVVFLVVGLLLCLDWCCIVFGGFGFVCSVIWVCWVVLWRGRLSKN
jgi:hypothetical protein